MDIVDIAGRVVSRLMNELKNSGTHTLTWNAKYGTCGQLASGVYFLRMVATPQKGGTALTIVHKLLLMK
jgi:hypothetical protein